MHRLVPGCTRVCDVIAHPHSLAFVVIYSHGSRLLPAFRCFCFPFVVSRLSCSSVMNRGGGGEDRTSWMRRSPCSALPLQSANVCWVRTTLTSPPTTTTSQGALSSLFLFLFLLTLVSLCPGGFAFSLGWRSSGRRPPKCPLRLEDFQAFTWTVAYISVASMP